MSNNTTSKTSTLFLASVSFVALRVVGLLALAWLGTGCAHGSPWVRQAAATTTSARVGCRPEEVVVSDYETHVWEGGGHTWQATCHGKTYRCGSISGWETACTPVVASN